MGRLPAGLLAYWHNGATSCLPYEGRAVLSDQLHALVGKFSPQSFHVDIAEVGFGLDCHGGGIACGLAERHHGAAESGG